MAEKVTKVDMSERTLAKVKSLLPGNAVRMPVTDSIEGHMPPDAYNVVGIVSAGKKHFCKNNKVLGDYPYIRLTLKEVEENGELSNHNVDMFAYGQHADTLDNVLKTAGEDCWMLVQKVKLVKYKGYPQEGYTRLGFNLGSRKADGSGETAEAKLLVVCFPSS